MVRWWFITMSTWSFYCPEIFFGFERLESLSFALDLNSQANAIA